MYLTVTEIDAALVSLAAAYPASSQLISTPHPTHEGRTCRLLRVGTRPAGAVDGLLVLGGVHAREWMPPDLCVSLAADLLEAHAGGTGLGYGGATYSAAEVQRLLETVNVYLFPCVNPDGRAFTEAGDAGWRKNRRPAPAGAGGASCVGVDLNRNFDFLWDHTVHFAPDADVHTSASPCDYQVYRGPSAASEPETQNVVWVLDTFPRVRWLVDVHSAVPVVLHSWGSDSNQSTKPGDNFTNPALDGVRGRLGDGVGEYISARDQDAVVQLADLIRTGVDDVAGSDYPVEQAMTLYPTSGASDDYAFSRHAADPTKTKVFGWTVECGTSFQPPYAAAEGVIREMSSGLIRFGLQLHAITDGLAVSLRTPALAFVDVPAGETTARAVVLDCSGDLDVHLEVVTGPTGGFTLPLGPTVTVPAAGAGATRPGRLWVSWTAGAAGTTAGGMVTLRCAETAEVFQIPVTANAVAPPKVAVALVLDRSGSMTADAGDGRTRVEVLREAAGVFLEVLQPANGVGLVQFDHDAQVVLPVVEAGPEVFGPGRAAAQAAVAAHTPNPAGATSIGDGIEAAMTVLAAAPGALDHHALVVLTDGQENAPKLIADVAGSLTDTAFAIGLGEPSAINPAALDLIAGGAGGRVVVTGALSVDERFLLAQYFLQILAAVQNDQVVIG
jgi:murein tripeptide amidase MpaA